MHDGIWDLTKNFELGSIATLIDVGVNRGTPDLYAVLPDPYYVLIEPVSERVPDLEAILETHRGEYIIAAAGSHPGSATLNVETERIGLTSFLPRTALTRSGTRIEQREVPTTTLDEVAERRNLSAPYGIKIDTEGYELEVIRGASRILDHTAWVIAEVSVLERFVGGYQAHELIGALRARGFAVADVIRSTKRYTDLLFTPIRNHSAT